MGLPVNRVVIDTINRVVDIHSRQFQRLNCNNVYVIHSVRTIYR